MKSSCPIYRQSGIVNSCSALFFKWLFKLSDNFTAYKLLDKFIPAYSYECLLEESLTMKLQGLSFFFSSCLILFMSSSFPFLSLPLHLNYPLPYLLSSMPPSLSIIPLLSFFNLHFLHISQVIFLWTCLARPLSFCCTILILKNFICSLFPSMALFPTRGFSSCLTLLSFFFSFPFFYLLS